MAGGVGMAAQVEMGFGFGMKQITTMVAGLYHLANCDGITDGERRIISEFASDAGAPELVDQLESLTFDPVEAYRVLETSWLRRLFIKAALLVVREDGKVSGEEEEALIWIADAFGIEGGFAALMHEIEGESL